MHAQQDAHTNVREHPNAHTHTTHTYTTHTCTHTHTHHTHTHTQTPHTHHHYHTHKHSLTLSDVRGSFLDISSVSCYSLILQLRSRSQIGFLQYKGQLPSLWRSSDPCIGAGRKKKTKKKNADKLPAYITQCAIQKLTS